MFAQHLYLFYESRSSLYLFIYPNARVRYAGTRHKVQQFIEMSGKPSNIVISLSSSVGVCLRSQRVCYTLSYWMRIIFAFRREKGRSGRVCVCACQCLCAYGTGRWQSFSHSTMTISARDTTTTAHAEITYKLSCFQFSRALARSHTPSQVTTHTHTHLHLHQTQNFDKQPYRASPVKLTKASHCRNRINSAVSCSVHGASTAIARILFGISFFFLQPFL